MLFALFSLAWNFVVDIMPITINYLRWDVKCCKLDQWCQRDCFITDYINGFGLDLYYFQPEEYRKSANVFVGFFSDFDSTEE